MDEENGNQAENNNQNEAINTTAGQQDKANEKKEQVNNNKAVQTSKKFLKHLILAHLPAFLAIIAAIFLLLMIIGILDVIITMPGMIIGKLREMAHEWLAKVDGWITGDNISWTIKDEDLKDVAQYVQDMGFDLVGYGFGDNTTYDSGEDEDTEEETEKDGIENSTIDEVDSKYLFAYLVQDTAIYTRAVWSWKGAFLPGDAESWAKGMINIDDSGTGNARIKIDPDLRVMEVEVPGEYLDENTYRFNMANWSSKYGKPLELFLALHVSTMMPDFTYDLATNQEFNTKVNIAFKQQIATFDISYHNTVTGQVVDESTIKQVYETMMSKPAGTEQGGQQDYLNNGDGEWVTVREERHDQYGNVLYDSDGNIVYYEYTYYEYDNVDCPLKGLTVAEVKALRDLITDGDAGEKIYYPYIESVKNHWYYNDFSFTYASDEGGATKKTLIYKPDDTTNILYDIAGNITIDALMPNGIYQVCEPDVTGPNPAIVALFKGGNSAYPKFTGKYYRYDGTRDKAQKIANAKAKSSTYKFMNQTYDKEPVTVYKEPVTFQDVDSSTPSNKNAFSAFAILENAHTEEAETSYRCLKELLVNLNYFTEEELTTELENVMMWPIKTTDIKEDFDVVVDANAYGFTIQNVKDREIVAPENCKVTVKGNVATLKFTQMSDETVALLEYIYRNDFKSIDKNMLVGLTMKIEGIKDVKTGNVKRGETIGKAEDNVKITMLDVDKSAIENIEQYMDQEQNYASEENMKNKKNNTSNRTKRKCRK